jgi:hypothetical protein
LAGEHRLRSSQEVVLQRVLELAAQSAVIAFQTGGPEGSLLYPLLEYDGSAKLSLPNVLRRAAGGEVPVLRHRDRATKVLAELARDAYPALLLPQPDERPGGFPSWVSWSSSLGPLVFRHPARAAFETAALADPTIVRMFPRETPESGRTGWVWTSLGTGRGTQLSMLAQDLLGAAAIRVTLDGADSQDAFVEAAIGELTLLRRLLEGEQVRTRCTIGFVGAELVGAPVQTPWGVLRSPTKGELELRAGLSIAHSQELALATDVPLQISLEEQAAPAGRLPTSPLTRQAETTFADIQRQAERIALALLLGLERKPPVAIARTWTIVENPLSQGVSISWFEDAASLHPHVLEREDRRRIRAWSERIEHHYSDRIEIAVKRALSSLTTRRDPADRLIDAVIALENLFGAGDRGELSFRISTGCAWLLERDAPAREALQSRVSKLYTRRSRIVHGAHAPDPRDLIPDAEEAADLAVRCLRVLFGRRKDLIDEPNRARRLVLQF